VQLRGFYSGHFADVNNAHQLLVGPAYQASFVVATVRSCKAGGSYIIPRGNALVITGANFYNSAMSLGKDHSLQLRAGPAATPCMTFLTAATATDSTVSQNQVYNPGIPVPAGDTIGLAGFNDTGSAEIFGYLTGSQVFSARALQHLPAAEPGGLAIVNGRAER